MNNGYTNTVTIETIALREWTARVLKDMSGLPDGNILDSERAALEAINRYAAGEKDSVDEKHLEKLRGMGESYHPLLGPITGIRAPKILADYLNRIVHPKKELGGDSNGRD